MRRAALLRRQIKLGEVVLYEQDRAIPALYQAIAQGSCRQVEEIILVGKKSL